MPSWEELSSGYDIEDKSEVIENGNSKESKREIKLTAKYRYGVGNVFIKIIQNCLQCWKILEIN